MFRHPLKSRHPARLTARATEDPTSCEFLSLTCVNNRNNGRKKMKLNGRMQNTANWTPYSWRQQEDKGRAALPCGSEELILLPRKICP